MLKQIVMGHLGRAWDLEDSVLREMLTVDTQLIRFKRKISSALGMSWRLFYVRALPIKGTRMKAKLHSKREKPD